jgi:protoheme ferro-lyase
MNESITVPDLIDSASRLNEGEFDSFFRQVLALRARRIVPVATGEETKLLQAIYKKLPPAILKRYDTLTAKRKEETITDAEYEELMTLTKQVEQYNVARLGQYIVELAALRGVTPQELMTQLGLMRL